MGKRMLTGLAAVAVLFAFGAGAAGSPPELTVKTSRVVIYKDGNCMFVKEVTGNVDAAGKAVIRDVPESVALGTFWLTSEDGATVRTVASQETVVRKGQTVTRRTLEVTVLRGAVPAAGPVRLKLQHFGPGIRWIPTYRIVLGADGRAEMRMQAEIMNEIDDLRDVAADLVVGVPNFRFKDVASPMTLEAALRNFLIQVAPQLMGQGFSNALFTQRSGEFRGAMGAPAAPGAAAPGVPAIPGELAGEGAQDLFAYHLPGLDLEIGQRAAVPVFMASVPYRHLYAWDVQLGRTDAEALPGVRAYASPIRLLKNDVWHLIELTNATSVPWTTGTALVMDRDLPIGQELFTYTSIGGKCQVPVTVAVDVRGTCAEEETAREIKAVHYNGSDYTRVTKKGTLRVTNYKKEAVALVVTCALGGNASKTSDDGRISVTDYDRRDWGGEIPGNSALNGHSVIVWEFTLEPGKPKELTCEYAFYR